MSKEIIIIALLLALIYLYYQKKPRPILLTGNSSDNIELAELKTKLGEKTLDEILEENEDYETEVDTLTRTKNSLEQDLLAQSNAFQNRLREKDRETKKLKEDLGNLEKRFQKCQGDLSSEKQISKGSVERISKLIEEIDDLQRKLDFQEKVSNNSEWGLNFKNAFEHEQRAKEFYQQSKDLHEQCSRLNDKLNWLRSLVRAGDLTQLQSLVRGGKI